jgi:hypothetical protein
MYPKPWKNKEKDNSLIEKLPISNFLGAEHI